MTTDHMITTEGGGNPGSREYSILIESEACAREGFIGHGQAAF